MCWDEKFSITFLSDSPLISHSPLLSDLNTFYADNVIITIKESKESFDKDTTVLNPVLPAGHVADRGLPLAHGKG